MADGLSGLGETGPTIAVVVFAVLIVILFINAVQQTSVVMGSRTLQQRFRSLGVIKGKTRMEIVELVGAPNSIQALAQDKVLLLWSRPRYQVALRFDGGHAESLCEGVVSETAV